MTLKKQALACAVTLLAMASVPAMADGVVNIGYSGPLSGGAAQYGEQVLDGMQMAAQEVDQAGLTVGGKPLKLNIVPLDDQYNPSATAINVRRLAQQSDASVVLVPHSGGIYAVQTFNQPSKILLLAYSSTSPITEHGNTLTIRIPPEFVTYMAPFTKYEMARFGKKIAFANTDTDYGKDWSTRFRPIWEKAGGTVVIDNPMSYNHSTDFYSGVSRILAAKPDVIFVGGPSEPTGLIIKQARELGFKGGFVVMDQAKLDDISKTTGGYGPLEGAIGVLPVQDDPSPAAREFTARFEKSHGGRAPTSEDALNYTAVWATAEAMKIAGTTTDTAAIRKNFDAGVKALSENHNPDGVSGVDPHGGLIMGRAVLGYVQNGAVKPLTETQ